MEGEKLPTTTVTTFIADDPGLELLSPEAFTRYVQVLHVLCVQVLGEDLSCTAEQMDRLEKSISIYDVVVVTEALANNPNMFKSILVTEIDLPSSVGEMRRRRYLPSPTYDPESVVESMDQLSVDETVSWADEVESQSSQPAQKLSKTDQGKKRVYSEVVKTPVECVSGIVVKAKASTAEKRSESKSSKAEKLPKPAKATDKVVTPAALSSDEGAVPKSVVSVDGAKAKSTAQERARRRTEKARAEPYLREFPLRVLRERMESGEWERPYTGLTGRESFSACTAALSCKDWRKISGVLSSYYSEVVLYLEGTSPEGPLIEEASRWKRLSSSFATSRVDVFDAFSHMKQRVVVRSSGEATARVFYPKASFTVLRD